jgi:hypothetical protein
MLTTVSAPQRSSSANGEAPVHLSLSVVALCALAGLRVFVFSAAFPFFNNVDEAAHFDLVHKYSRCHVPTGLEHMDLDSARDVVMYGSPEYVAPATRNQGGAVPPPVWSLPPDQFRKIPESRVSQMAQTVNYESTEPPLYYAVAGLWYRIGLTLGLRGGRALYWIRFMNAIIAALLVWLAYGFAHVLFPADRFLSLGMPLLVAFFPQDALYSVTNDVLLPLVGGAALLALFVIVRVESKGYAFHAAAGLLVAAALLVKTSSAPLGMIAIATAVLVAQRASTEERRAAIRTSAVLLLAAAIPLVVWELRNIFVLGDVTGSGSKVAFFGWSLKRAGAILQHPLFTPGGVATFWHDTIASFWRGELTWHMDRIASGGWDLFFSLSSLVLPVAAVVAPVVRARHIQRDERAVLWLSLAMCLLSLLFLGGISVIFDFDGCFYPSRAYPFLASGRLALAALLPFVALYLKGLEALLPGPRTEAFRWVLLIGFVAFMTGSETRLSLGAFHSAYNWFHLQ